MIIMALTLSFSKGNLSPYHDMRIGKIPDNVDPNLMCNNCVMIDKLGAFDYDIESYTNEKFQPFIDAYNAKQTRDNRKKTKPYVEILKEENEKLLKKAEENKKEGKKTSVRKPTPIALEYVMQFGNRDTNGTIAPSTNMEQNKYAAYLFLQKFQKKYPHMDILLASFHGDEPNGTPHLHLVLQPTGENYKQGLEQQISLSKALECDGFERKNVRGDYAIERWLNDVKDGIMEDVLQEVFQEERDILGEHRKHEPTVIFRQKAKDEAKALEEERNSTQEAKAKFEAYVTSQDQRLLEVHDKLLERRDRLLETQNTLDTERTSLTEEKAKFDAYKASEIQSLQEREKTITDKENYLKAFSERTAEIFSEALEWLEKVKNLYNALDATHKALYKKQIAQLDERLLPQKQKQRQRSKSL